MKLNERESVREFCFFRWHVLTFLFARIRAPCSTHSFFFKLGVVVQSAIQEIAVQKAKTKNIRGQRTMLRNDQERDPCHPKQVVYKLVFVKLYPHDIRRSLVKLI